MNNRAEENGDEGQFDRRIWRLEQRQQDVRARLDKLEQNVAEMRERQENRRYYMETLEARLITLEKKAAGPMFGDYAPIVRLILLCGAMIIISLMTGQALNITGLIR